MNSWFVLWLILSSAGIFFVYRIGLRIERRHPNVSLAFFVLFGPAMLVASWLAASQLAGLDQATCDEMDPSTERLHGVSPSEFRSRCIATQDNSEWLARRKL